jgi:hypothetical protein
MCLSGAAMAADGWTATGNDLPAVMTWDGVAGVTVNTTNSGDTIWDDTFALASVMGPTLSATATNRWGIPEITVSGTVDPAADYDFSADIVAPPITTFNYATPITPTTVGTIVGFSNNWQLDDAGTLVTTDMVAADTVIERFPDIGPDEIDPRSWANAFQIEQLAGRVPMVVQGYPDGTYRPIANVTRTAMAVYMQRAMDLPMGDYTGAFSDIPLDYINAGQIQACIDAGIVVGYPDGTYRPMNIVNRGSMAVYVARGLAGGDEFVPSPAPVSSFTDVLITDQPWKYIEYCVDAGVVQGYPDGTYRQPAPVNRGAMAVYMYRAFIQSTDTVVVVAGPAITSVDTDAAGYDGWSSTGLAAPATPRTAYVGFDAVRLGDDQVVTVSFSVMDGDTELAASGDLMLDASTVKPGAVASGIPYAYVKWDLPLDLPVGVDYDLVTTVDGNVLDRQPTFSVGTVGAIMAVEGFEGNALPSGWTVVDLNGGTSQWGVSTIASDEQWMTQCGTPAAPDNHTGAPLGVPTGTYALMSWPNATNPDWDGGGNEGEVITAAIDCTGFVAPQLHFSGAVAINTGSDAGGDCQYSIDGGTTWTSVDPDNASDGGWWCACCDGSGWRSPDGYIDFTFDLPGAGNVSNVLVKWTFTGGCCWGWIVDDVSVTGLH